MSESAHPSEQGYISLVVAMWGRLHLDLKGLTNCGRKTRSEAIREAILFLNDPQFDRWCELCGARPEDAREVFRAEIPPIWREYMRAKTL